MTLTAEQLDAQDELAAFRNRFVIDDPDLVYVDGNSLGRMPKAAVERVKVLADEWGSRLVRGWDDWIHLSERLGSKIAGIVGANPNEVLVSDSTTVNLFKLVWAAMMARPGRTKVVTDDLNFPSDIYAISSVLHALGPQYRLEIVRSIDGIAVDTGQIARHLDEDTALLTLSHSSFKSAYLHDMAALTDLAHRAGSLALWDVCHSVGVAPIDLSACAADLAVGCTYKYLNGGPGSPAFVYVREDLLQQMENPIWGWFGQHDPFAFEIGHSARAGIAKFQVGTPPILSLGPIESGVDLILEAGVDRIREKSVRQTDYLVELWERHLKGLGVTLNSPRDSARRGSHIAFGHPEALRIDRALIEEMNVVPDFRVPDNIRYGATPLSTTYAELEEGVLRLKVVLDRKLYERYPTERPTVT